MTTYTQILHQQIEQLPPSYQAEASRYLDFLLQKALSRKLRSRMN